MNNKLQTQINYFRKDWYWYTGLLLAIMSLQIDSKALGVMGVFTLTLNIIGSIFGKDIVHDKHEQENKK